MDFSPVASLASMLESVTSALSAAIEFPLLDWLTAKTDNFIAGLISMAIITVSVLAWALLMGAAGKIFDKKSRPAVLDHSDLEPPRAPVKPLPHSNRPADPRLLQAVRTGNWSDAYQLLEQGILPTGVDNYGKSLLDIASSNHDTHMVELLKTHGAVAKK